VTARSIAEQSFTDFEWIVIDGASTDGTLAQLAPFRSRINHLICEPDHGIYDAMNKGLRLARGQFVFFLNAGDWLIHDRVLEDVARTPLSPEQALVYGRVRFLDPKTGYTKTMGFPFSWREVGMGLFPLQPGCFFNRGLLAEFGGFRVDLCFAADLDAILRLCATGREIRFLETEITAFPMTGVSSRMDWKFVSFREQVAVVRRYAPLSTVALHRVWLPWTITRRVLSHMLERIGLLNAWRAVKQAMISNS
jgi:glycosyltransferase involved in cell wall biosynthesis